jgi:hypothetical protein
VKLHTDPRKLRALDITEKTEKQVA